MLQSFQLRPSGTCTSVCCQWPADSTSPPRKDPEQKFRRLGSKSTNYVYREKKQTSWWYEAPRIRLRDKEERVTNLWGELAALNERLGGGDPVATRKKIDYLRVRKQHWARIISAATEYDTAITLAQLEDANRKVAEALQDRGMRERAPVGVLKRQLMSLQADVAAAHERLHTTEARLAVNLARIHALQSSKEAGRDVGSTSSPLMTAQEEPSQ